MTAIHGKMVKIMTEMSAISKGRKNTQQNYSFRGIDDIYNELHDVMAKNGVFCLPKIVSERVEDRQSKSGGVLVYRVLHMEFSFVADDGSSVVCSTIGEGMDSGDKASNKAMSTAQKYAFIQTFIIPTEDLKDSENDSSEVLDSKRVGINTHNLIQKLMTENIKVERFASFLVKNKMLMINQHINDLEDHQAERILNGWANAKASFQKYCDE